MLILIISQLLHLPWIWMPTEAVMCLPSVWSEWRMVIASAAAHRAKRRKAALLCLTNTQTAAWKAWTAHVRLKGIAKQAMLGHKVSNSCASQANGLSQERSISKAAVHLNCCS